MAVILRYFSEFAYLPGGMLKVTFAISSLVHGSTVPK